jgi:hypothetical protein
MAKSALRLLHLTHAPFSGGDTHRATDADALYRCTHDIRCDLLPVVGNRRDS